MINLDDPQCPTHAQRNLLPYRQEADQKQLRSIEWFVVKWIVLTCTPSCVVASHPTVTLSLAIIVVAACNSDRAQSSRAINPTVVFCGIFSAFTPVRLWLCKISVGIFAVGTLLTIWSKTINRVVQEYDFSSVFILITIPFQGIQALVCAIATPPLALSE